MAVGDYRLEQLIGRGGMGVVYRATQVSLGRTVAIKLIAEAAADDPAFRARFKREARLAAGIDHPNVIPVYQADEAAGRLYIAMRYVEGTDLGALIAARGPLPAEEAAAIVEQVAAALDAAHARGLVHRDVKPGNVLVDRTGNVYLTDFGITKQVASRTGLTLEGGLVGTLDYAAPEQLRGDAVDARTDVYALGCLLFELLTGEVPYRRASEGEKVLAHLASPPPRPSESRSDLPAGFDAVVACAMAKEPDARFASAGELARAAHAALAGERLTIPAAPAPGATAPLARATAPLAAATAPVAGAPLDADPRRGRPVALLGVAVAIGAAGLVVAAPFGERKEPLAPYQQAVAGVCADVNRVQAARTRRFEDYRHALRRKRTLHGHVDVIVGELQLRIAAGADLRSRLAAISAPSPELAQVQRETIATWDRNLGRLRTYRDGLRRVNTYRGLRKRVGALPESRMERDSVAVATGLRQLGGPACRLDPPTTDALLRITSPTGRAIAVTPGPAAAAPRAEPDSRSAETPPAPTPTPRSRRREPRASRTPIPPGRTPTPSPEPSESPAGTPSPTPTASPDAIPSPSPAAPNATPTPDG
jgi:predicted Ser/Thr protein kinase